MKKFSIALSAIVIAVVCFSFTNAKKQAACLTNLYWFTVGGSSTSDLSTAISQVTIVLDADNDGVKDELPFRTQSAVLSNELSFCQATATNFCGLAYSADQIERVEIPTGSGNFYYRPIQSPVQTPKCTVKKP